MPTKKPAASPQKIGTKQSKRDLLDAYQQLVQQMEGSGALPPPKEPTPREAQAVEQAMHLSVDEVLQNATGLRLELHSLFTKLANRITAEVNQFEQLQLAVEVKERELQDRYRMEACAAAITTLEESYCRKKAQLDAEMEHVRREWEREQTRHAAEDEDRKAQAERERAREEEAFRYQFGREQQIARDGFKDKMARLLAEQEAIEEDLKQREEAIAAREQEIKSMDKQIKGLPQTIERAVEQALKDKTAELQRAAEQERALLLKQTRGEKGVLNAKIKALEATVKEQRARLKSVSDQRDSAQQHLQSIALRELETPLPPDETPTSSAPASTPKERIPKKRSMIPPLRYPGESGFDA